MPKCAPNPPKPKPKKLPPQREVLLPTQDNERRSVAKSTKPKPGAHLPQNRQILPEIPTPAAGNTKTPALKPRKVVPKVKATEVIQPAPKPVAKTSKHPKTRAPLPMNVGEVQEQGPKNERKTRSPLRKATTTTVPVPVPSTSSGGKALKPKESTNNVRRKKKFVRKDSPFPFEALNKGTRGGAGFLSPFGRVCHVNAVHCRLTGQNIAVIPYVSSHEFVVYAPIRRKKNFFMRRKRSRSVAKVQV